MGRGTERGEHQINQSALFLQDTLYTSCFCSNIIMPCRSGSLHESVPHGCTWVAMQSGWVVPYWAQVGVAQQSQG